MTDYGWPPQMITAVAARYCQCSRWTIAAAVRAGELAAVGKRGRSLVFDRAELDRWMRGAPSAPLSDVPRETAAPARSAERPSSAILERLARIRSGDVSSSHATRARRGR